MYEKLLRSKAKYLSNLKNVTFAYDDCPVLSEISLKIEKGENIGLVGVSVLAKTILISLLAKIYKPP